jgi:hypothetical protein
MQAKRGCPSRRVTVGPLCSVAVLLCKYRPALKTFKEFLYISYMNWTENNIVWEQREKHRHCCRNDENLRMMKEIVFNGFAPVRSM